MLSVYSFWSVRENLRNEMGKRFLNFIPLLKIASNEEFLVQDAFEHKCMCEESNPSSAIPQ